MKSRKRIVSLLLIMTLVAAMVFGTTVSAAKKSVTLNKSTLTIYVGKTAQLKATVTGMKKKPTWKSSKPSVATVKSNGVIKAKKAGKTTITAKVGKKTAKCVVTVKKMNYKKAYADFLAKRDTFSPPDELFYDASYSPNNSTFVNEFILADINKDKTPELITYTYMNFRWYIVRVYTYKDGKVRPMKFTNGNNVEFDNNASANGRYNFYVCPRKHIHNNYSGGFITEQTVYKVDKKVKEYLHIQYDPVSVYDTVYQSRKNGKKVNMSLTEFTKLAKDCKSIFEQYRYTNTEYNRTQLANGKCKVNK